jgi:16S rRNA (guanine(966)-N(2))-methyltransferase RsmD
MFSWLDHRLGGAWDGLAVLDLYAGSGALAFEALSRGADRATLVERDRAALAVIRRNIATLDAADRTIVQGGSVFAVAARPGARPNDVVFADPPYDVPAEEIAAALDAYRVGGWIHSDALLVVETSRRATVPWPVEITALQRREYGDTAIWYGRRHISASGDEED